MQHIEEKKLDIRSQHKPDSNDEKNIKRLDEAVITQIRTLLQDEPDGYYSKQNPIFKDIYNKLSAEGKKTYSIIKEQGKFYAVYAGKNNEKYLGVGGQGKVKLGQDLVSGEFVAIKIIMLWLKKAHYLKSLHVEVQALQRLGRLQSYKTHKKLTKNQSLFIKKNKQYPDMGKGVGEKAVVVMQYEEGVSIKDFCWQHQDSITEKTLLTILLNMAVAVQSFHAQQYLHRDIKPNNFLVDPNTLNVTLIDFGCAIYVGSQGLIYEHIRYGHTYYHSPKVAMEFEDNSILYCYSVETEGYALGRAFEELLIIPGFYDVVDSSVLKLIASMCSINGVLEQGYFDPEFIPPNLTQVIQQLTVARDRSQELTFLGLIKKAAEEKDSEGKTVKLFNTMLKRFIRFAREQYQSALEILKPAITRADFQKLVDQHLQKIAQEDFSKADPQLAQRVLALIWLFANTENAQLKEEISKKWAAYIAIKPIRSNLYTTINLLYNAYPDEVFGVLAWQLSWRLISLANSVERLTQFKQSFSEALFTKIISHPLMLSKTTLRLLLEQNRLCVINWLYLERLTTKIPDWQACLIKSLTEISTFFFSDPIMNKVEDLKKTLSFAPGIKISPDQNKVTDIMRAQAFVTLVGQGNLEHLQLFRSIFPDDYFAQKIFFRSEVQAVISKPGIPPDVASWLVEQRLACQLLIPSIAAPSSVPGTLFHSTAQQPGSGSVTSLSKEDKTPERHGSAMAMSPEFVYTSAIASKFKT